MQVEDELGEIDVWVNAVYGLSRHRCGCRGGMIGGEALVSGRIGDTPGAMKGALGAGL